MMCRMLGLFLLLRWTGRKITKLKIAIAEAIAIFDYLPSFELVFAMNFSLPTTNLS